MSTISNLPLLSTATGEVVFAVIDKGEPEPRKLRQTTLNQIGDFINREIVTYNIATATTTTLGGIIVGSGLTIDEGVLGVANIVTTATTATQGTIIVGDGLEIADGVLNVTSMGATGARGATGTRGSTGATGPRLVAAISTSKPLVAAAGDMWLDVGNSGQLLTYNGSVWIAAAPGGSIGETGIQGATGLQGATGATGFQGPVGATGLVGATGPQGIPGLFAGQGATGATGLQAIADVSATKPINPSQGDLWLDLETTGQLFTWDGFVWVSASPGGAGIVGATGETGPAGAGATGATGPAGETGPAGAGATGATGLAGDAGATGTQGATGPIGATGVQGATGPINPNTPLTLILTTNTSYTPTANDHGYYIRMTNAVTATVTLVADSTAAIPIGTTYIIGQCGTGTVVFTSGTSATIYTPGTLSIAGQWGKVSVFKVAVNTWEIDGYLIN
jgi:hypothetical protein